MRIFRNGYWQKAVAVILILAQLGALLYFLVLWFDDALRSQAAIWVLLALWVISLGLGIYIVNSSSSPEYKVSWLFLVGCVPLIGPVFYLLFAHKIRSRRAVAYGKRYYGLLNVEKTLPEVYEKAGEISPDGVNIAKMIENGRGGRLFSNSEISYFPLGDDAFPRMLSELEKAKHYIYIEYFILKPGLMWSSILEILKRKAKKGLDVRVIYDDVGTLGTLPRHYDRMLRKEGIKAYVYRPIKPVVDVRINNRNHRKILVIDGHTAFTGGINLADEYINKESRFGHWKDNAIMIKGKAVYGYTLLFLADFEANFGRKEKRLEAEELVPERYIDEAGGFPASDGFVLPYGMIPYDPFALGEEVYIALLSKAKRYVYMSTPYFLPDSKLLDAIKRAAVSGVEVRLLIPHIPDKKLVFELTRKNCGAILEAGAKVYEYTPGFVHEKMFVVDDELAAVGTINLDSRSLYLHSENGTFLIGSRAIAHMRQDFEDTFAVSEEMTYEKWRKRRRSRFFLWALLELFSPLL